MKATGMSVSYTHLDVYKRPGEAWQKVSDAAKTIVTLASQGKMTELPSPKSSVEGDVTTYDYELSLIHIYELSRVHRQIHP